MAATNDQKKELKRLLSELRPYYALGEGAPGHDIHEHVSIVLAGGRRHPTLGLYQRSEQIDFLIEVARDFIVDWPRIGWTELPLPKAPARATRSASPKKRSVGSAVKKRRSPRK